LSAKKKHSLTMVRQTVPQDSRNEENVTLLLHRDFAAKAGWLAKFTVQMNYLFYMKTGSPINWLLLIYPHERQRNGSSISFFPLE